MTIPIIAILLSILTPNLYGYAQSNNIYSRWNPLQFPNTQLYAILTFDTIEWNKITNQTSDSSEEDNEYIDFICDIIRQCFHDAFGYTLLNTVTTETTPTPTDSSLSQEYDRMLHRKISLKNIKKSLLSHNRINYTFGVLFNDMDIYDEYALMTNANYHILRTVFYQCIHLSLTLTHVSLHVMSVSEGMYPNTDESPNSNNNTNPLDIDLQQPASTENIVYRVMITLNADCLLLKGINCDAVIDQIILFYADCLDDDDDRYITYYVSDIEMVYFFTIVGNDRACLIEIDMEYLQNKCVDMIEYEPIYELDLTYSAQCDAMDAQSSWNLDFFDGTAFDGTYSILQTSHDHGVDLYILDTGILSTHDVFWHNSNRNLVYIHQLRTSTDGSVPVSTTQFIPSHFHGTYVAGIAGGNLYGVSRNLTIYDYEVCEGSSCSYSKVLAGIEAAKTNMLDTSRRGVINLSFGGPIAPTNELARQKWDFIMEAIIESGGIPICSAGNTQINGCNYVPGQSQYCISVGAFDQFGNLYSRTNFGECVNIFAPGVSIESAGTSTNSQSITRSGTSAAAPHITGLISNLLYLNPTLTFEHILYILEENTQFLSSCPNEYTEQTECPYIQLGCAQFENAITDAVNNVNVPMFTWPTNAPTHNPTTHTPTESTNTPTHKPVSNNPTESPSVSPVINPSNNPTVTPTTYPSVTPTDIPTAFPTDQPTLNPSKNPTISPTLLPTNIPSANPTKFPTQSPTNVPTLMPTISPSITPTLSPSQIPSKSPINYPTVRPTLSPSFHPSASPTISPSVTPTLSPTENPTNTPTKYPSVTPTSVSPTLSPTIGKPSVTPTMLPTQSPVPSVSPTEIPTMSPSNAPTNVPTDIPSARHEGLGLHGFNNGFTVDVNTANENGTYQIQSPFEHRSARNNRQHNSGHSLCHMSFDMLLILFFSLVLSFFI